MVDRRYMEMALHEARLAGERGEVPIGAVLVKDEEVIATRGNERERRNDPTAHAEMLILRDAAAVLGGWRIPGATVYVTLEPCPMCAGALVLARIDRLVYGAKDPKSGAAGTVMDLTADPTLNHRMQVTAGVGEAEAAEMLQEFFGRRR